MEDKTVWGIQRPAFQKTVYDDVLNKNPFGFELTNGGGDALGEHCFNHMVKRYNEIYRVQMLNITPHICRHTYCSNMAKSGMNLKTL